MVWSFSLNRIPLHASGWIQDRPSDDAEREDCTSASEGVDWKQGSALVFKRLREKICRVGIVRFWPKADTRRCGLITDQPDEIADYLCSERNDARISCTNRSGCSHAAKWPPRGSLL